MVFIIEEKYEENETWIVQSFIKSIDCNEIHVLWLNSCAENVSSDIWNFVMFS